MEPCDSGSYSRYEGGTDFREWQAKALGFIPFIGYASSFLNEVLFLIICAGPAHIIFSAKREENIIVPFCFRIFTEIPGCAGQGVIVHLVSPHFKYVKKIFLRIQNKGNKLHEQHLLQNFPPKVYYKR